MKKTLLLSVNIFFRSKLKLLSIIVQLFIAIVIINISIALICNVLYMRYFVSRTNLHESIYFYAAPQYTHSLDMKADDEIKNMLSEITEIDVFGSINTSFIRKPDGNEIIKALVYDTSIIKKVKLPVSYGRWFSNDDIMQKNGTIPAVIGSDMHRDFKLNHTYNIMFSTTPDTWVMIDIKVIGILNVSGYSINLSGNNLDNMVEGDFKGIIIPYNENLSQIYQMKYNGGVLLYPQSDGINEVDETMLFITGKTSSYGELKDFYHLLKDFEKSNEEVINLTLSLGIIVLIVSIAGLGGNNILSVMQNEKIFGIYYMCGAKWKDCIKIVLLKDIVILIIPFLFSVCILKILRDISNMDFIISNITSNLISVGICMVIFFITSVGPLIDLYKKDPISIIREWV